MQKSGFPDGKSGKFAKVSSIILTRVDGDGRGGAALSMKYVTGKPIKFIGVGEKINSLSIHALSVSWLSFLFLKTKTGPIFQLVSFLPGTSDPAQSLNRIIATSAFFPLKREGICKIYIYIFFI